MADEQKEKPQEQPELPLVESEEEENDVADQDPDPEFDPPLTKPDGEPAWKEKETSKWPIWLVLGLLVLLVAVVVVSKTISPAYKGPEHYLTTTPDPNVPLKPDALAVNSLYEAEDPVPMVEKMGDDPAGTTAKMLPVRTQFAVLEVKTVGEMKWYSVKLDVTGAKGWISVNMLIGKKVILVRDQYKI